MNELLPSNATPLVRAIESEFSRPDKIRSLLLNVLNIKALSESKRQSLAEQWQLPSCNKAAFYQADINLLLTVLWDDELCPAAMLPALAEALKIADWERYLDDRARRRALQDACILQDIRLLLRAIWDPMLCPASLLPWLAWAMSVDEWDETWSETLKRRVICDAFAVHQYKGTPYALQKALDSLNIATEIKEWWQSEGADTPSDEVMLPGTIKVWALVNQNLDDQQQGLLTPQMLKKIRRVINAVKRGAIHVDLQLGIALSESLAPFGAAQSALNLIDHKATGLGVTPDSTLGALAAAAAGHLVNCQRWHTEGEGITPDQSEGVMAAYAQLQSLNTVSLKAESSGVMPDPVVGALALSSGLDALNIQSFHFQGVT
ncbi:phage tail protein I [Pseudoalteromonas rubra]|uniref:Phage tail protein I n=1 Tax=Pseudoalteromonas rubra TaxID=43658 RepID=A0A5S3WQZ3_9GAMM|nr:phage tail protein I [Pseudoalteromonas rubra]TMP30384.1 phage tail protein I [Pseudoalteromonas rubra]TMP35407.1 phage tail protein I [Pseudoalteromonas rubra]